jgi:alpha-1,3-glucosyltransferase
MFQGKHLQAAGLFALLLNLKHIYLYVAPAYFTYLLKKHCFTYPILPKQEKSGNLEMIRRFSPVKVIELGALVGTVFAVSFGPFLYHGQLFQVLSRLFPFKRGLCHAYWAPNVWALYSTADKVFSLVGNVSSGGGSMTSGLVGNKEHQVLPSVPPIITMLLTLAAIMPAMIRLWRKQTTFATDFLQSLVLCGYASFMFGWHVHEKAIMMVTIPMCLLVIEDHKYWRVFILLSTVGHISLFPLLFTRAETLIKVCLFVLYLIIAITSSTLLKG